jgi:hypothetical protein
MTEKIPRLLCFELTNRAPCSAFAEHGARVFPALIAPPLAVLFGGLGQNLLCVKSHNELKIIEPGIAIVVGSF